MITIVDYEAGNLRSVQNMLRSLNVESRIAGTPDEVADASKLILPGVGHFDFGMRQLADRDLVEILNQKVLEERTPILGICLGAQLLSRGSEEGQLPGLGWVAADTKRFDQSKLSSELRIPHMGWADTEFPLSNPLFRGVEPTPRYYYVHSFHLVCDEEESAGCWATHGYRFVSGLHQNNIFGVQFHPEKSHRFGKQILKNFASLRHC